MRQEEFSWQGHGGQKMFGKEWQPEADPKGVIVLVHGLGEHIGRYDHVAEAITQAGFALLGFDLPGHGRSGGIRGYASYDLISHEIMYVLKEAQQRFPGLPTFLYGHSMGGALVLYHTLKHQPAVHGVISTSPALASGQSVPQWKVLLAKLMAKINPAFVMDNNLDVDNLSKIRKVVTDYQNDPLVHSKISARLGLDLMTQGLWIVENAGSFPVPLLLVQGSGDHIVSTSLTANFAKAAENRKVTYKVWDDLYHETHNEPEQQQVLQYTLDWLNERV